jgi:predicted nucleotidyltransferase
MLNKRERKIIIRCAKKYRVSSVFLFGSSVETKTKTNDIDLGVKGIKPELFFKFYGELFKYLPRPVDLIDLSEKSLFNKLVEEEGTKIYGRH